MSKPAAPKNGLLPISVQERADIEFLNAHFFRILEASERIQADPELKYCTSELFHVGLMYVIGNRHQIPLGLLLQTWAQGRLIGFCKACGNRTLHAWCGGGSPLSGTHSFTGFCTHCKEMHAGRGVALRDTKNPDDDYWFTELARLAREYDSPPWSLPRDWGQELCAYGQPRVQASVSVGGRLLPSADIIEGLRGSPAPALHPPGTPRARRLRELLALLQT
jgi:hypothetical protein